MLTLGVLCSGGLGIDTLTKIAKEHTIKFVLTDSGSKEIIDFVIKNNIPYYAGNPRKGKGYNFIKNINVDVIASINYLFLIEKDIIDHSNILTFNIHGSLLPKYRGRTPHVWAIINGESEAGITAHVIDEGCDTGKIIHQRVVAITPGDTGATMLKKYAREYYPLVKEILEDILYNRLKLTKQKEEEATYFGKRTPDDGEINWNRKAQDIINWVRAQANPYPGAFTYYNNKKIIIDKVSLYEGEINAEKYAIGEIINSNPQVLVKCKNGIIVLDIIRTKNCIFEEGKIFENENRK
ncbi:methionyl-tRNA formyltransferase [Pontimicrobium sp. MEBiC01747]